MIMTIVSGKPLPRIRQRFAVGLLPALLVCLPLAAVPPVLAQSIPPGRFSVAGVSLNCGSVWTVIQPDLGDWARAVTASFQQPPMIVLDAGFMRMAPVEVQMFTYAHECGHHIVGGNEDAADCWAATTGKRQRWFTRQTMQFLVQAFQWSPGDWTHAPGPIRLQRIWDCWQNG